MYRVVLYRDAWKFLTGLDHEQQNRIRNKLKELKAWPVSHMDIKAMAGEFKGYHRLRIGSFRVLFVVDNTTQTIYVDHIGSRGDVYR